MGIQTNYIHQPEDRIVRLNERQEDYISIPDSIFEALYGGAAFGGKTFLLTLLPLIRGFYKHPKYKGIIFRKTFADLEKEIVRLSHEYYPSTGAIYNEQKKSWRWPWGSYVDMGHCENEKDIRNYDSAQYNTISFDESTHFSEFSYVYMTSRCRSRDSGLPAILRNGSNPGNVGHAWNRERFVEHCRTGYKIIYDVKSKTKRIFIPAFITDNKAGLISDPGYADRLELLPEAEKRAKKYGDWWIFEGQVFREFRNEKFPDEPDNALHVIDPFFIPQWWPKVLAIDWGFRAATWCGWAAISPLGRVYVYRELFCRETNIDEWATQVGHLSLGENLVDVVMCGSGWQKRGVETIANQFERYSKIIPRSAENNINDRISGKMLIHDFLRWKPKPTRKLSDNEYNEETAQNIYRKFGDKAYNEYLLTFAEEVPEDNLPKVQIFNCCQELIKAIPLCTYNDDSEKKKDDVKEFKGDDAYDGFRYLLKTAYQYINENTDEQEKQKRIQTFIKKLHENKDTTSYYRNMERVEKSNAVLPVRRFHSSSSRNSMRH